MNTTKINDEPVHPMVSYFVLKIDGMGRDQLHINASRAAARAYCDYINTQPNDTHLDKVAEQLEILLNILESGQQVLNKKNIMKTQDKEHLFDISTGICLSCGISKIRHHEHPKPCSNSPYGYCPKCGAPGILRERRPNGNDQCINGHTYPSRDANETPVTNTETNKVDESSEDMREM